MLGGSIAPVAPSPLHRGGYYDPPAAAGDRIGSSDLARKMERLLTEMQGMRQEMGSIYAELNSMRAEMANMRDAGFATSGQTFVRCGHCGHTKRESPARIPCGAAPTFSCGVKRRRSRCSRRLGHLEWAPRATSIVAEHLLVGRFGRCVGLVGLGQRFVHRPTGTVWAC
jgi:hypothetical protein